MSNEITTKLIFFLSCLLVADKNQIFIVITFFFFVFCSFRKILMTAPQHFIRLLIPIFREQKKAFLHETKKSSASWNLIDEYIFIWFAYTAWHE